MCIVKKTISFLLVFCLFAFSLFSTGCGSSSGAFKFIGAIVAVTIMASSGGAGAAVFAANLRGSTKTIGITKDETKVNVYPLDRANTPSLRGSTPILTDGTVSKDKNGNFAFNLPEEKRLGVGEYLFEAFHTGADKPFLRAILNVDGSSNNPALTISPLTEIKTRVYTQWLSANPSSASYANFEANLKKDTTSSNKITEEANNYIEDLAVWAGKDDTEKAQDEILTRTLEIVVPTETLVPTTTGTDTFVSSLPTVLQKHTWAAAQKADLLGKKFVQAYQKYNGSWVKLVADSEEAAPPDVSFMHNGVNFDFTQDMHDYSEQVMTTLMETATNDVATVYTQSDLYALGWGSYISIQANSRLSEDGKTLTMDASAFDAESTTVVNYTISVGKSGSDVYLYMKNITNTTTAEKIFKLTPM